MDNLPYMREALMICEIRVRASHQIISDLRQLDLKEPDASQD